MRSGGTGWPIRPKRPQLPAGWPGTRWQIAEEATAAMQFSAGELYAARWLDAEDPSLRQAQAWALEHDPDMALRLAVSLTPWQIMRGRHEEAHAQISAAARQAAPGTARWIEAQYWLGQAVAKSDQGAALAYYRAASEALGEGPPTPLLALALAGQSNMLNIIGRPEGMDLADRALAVAREVSHPCSLAFALMAKSQAAQQAGDLNAAADWARQASRIDPATIPGDFARDCHTTLAVILIDVGDLDGRPGELRRTAGPVPAGRGPHDRGRWPVSPGRPGTAGRAPG